MSLIQPITTRRPRSRPSRQVQRMRQTVNTAVNRPPQSYEAQAVAYAQSDERVERMAQQATQQRAMSVSTLVSPFDGRSFFDRCGDGDLMSLHFEGTLDLLDWMGFEVSDEARRVVEFMAYVRAAQDGGNPTTGHLADPCEDPKGIEYGTAKLEMEGFGRYGRKGPDRDFMSAKRYCATDPVRRIDGEIVTSESEWDLRFATDVILQDIRRDLVVGNSSVAGQFGGLEEWVSTSYTGPNADMLKSIVVDWNSNAMSGGSGITWNGAPVGSSYSLVSVLLAIWRRIRQRLMWTRQLANQQLRLGDAILLMPSFMAECLLDHFTCWSVCAGGEYSPVNLQQMEARQFRNRLVAADNPANLFGYGYINLDNTTIPIMAYDFGLIKGPTRGDMYLLTGGVGGTRIWEGEHLSASAALSALPQVANTGQYSTTDGGRILTGIVTENECYHMKAWMHPRIWCRAPWAQARIADVVCSSPSNPLSPDPNESSFYPLSSFTPAVHS